jgi:heme a synthase
MCVGMVVVTSKWWQKVGALTVTPGNKKFLRLAIFTTVLTYLQLVAGALVRHSPHLTVESAPVIFQAAVYFHVLLALAITVHVILLVWQASRNKIERGRSTALAALVGVQVLLGASTWMVKYGLPQWATAILGDPKFVNTADNAHQAGIVTSHVAVGSLILVTAVAITLRTAWQLRIGVPQLNAATRARIGAAI